ncbi:flagellar protein FlaG [Phenylobacterium sp. J426]|uniref:flagellar protein FlaG n=1 Tax=Phenylobacterium sp. J426 TaxID=2898439 RepID=UPI002151A61D|nr:flagellar protein FlaG [Phenylobacterium sp. J426]MCR5875945.1 flagellar protein FlaG [Phenylobacterium sp. J426]
MQSKVAPSAATPDPTLSQPKPAPGRHAGGEAKARAANSDPVDLRLVIEEDQASGSYVYKTIDRRTGEVVLQLPRADVLRLREETGYAAGAVIRTKA